MSEVNPDKPCPFCGNTTVQTTVDDGCHWSSCPKCAATGPAEFLRSDEDSPGWNTRPDFDRVTAERDAALADLKRHQSLFNQSVKALDRVHCMYMKRLLDLTGEPQVALVPDEEFVKYFEELKILKRENSGLQQRLTAADERADVLERDKARIDWLVEQPVDTLYLDDGRIIDIAGRVDLRDAIDAAMAAPAPSDDDCRPDHADANEPPCSACFARGCNGECMENL